MSDHLFYIMNYLSRDTCDWVDITSGILELSIIDSTSMTLQVKLKAFYCLCALGLRFRRGIDCLGCFRKKNILSYFRSHE